MAWRGTGAGVTPRIVVLMRIIIAALGALGIGAFVAFLLMPQRPAPQARFPELRGKVAVVNFWATWCPECVKETPRMVEAHRKFSARGYETVAVAVRDQPARVAEFASQRALPYKVVLDWEVVRRGLQVLADGEHVDIVRAQVAHDRQDLVIGFAEADHQAGLGWHAEILFFENLKQIERLIVVAARPCLLVEARNRFHV